MKISDLRDTYIVSACRTAIGEFGGGFKDVRADALAASGRLLESLTEVTRVYEAGVKAFEDK
jgi:acetyl-CoA acetyltransferase